VGVLLVDHAAERGGHEHLALHGEELVRADRLHLGELREPPALGEMGVKRVSIDATR
jgi:hypothetical protein